MVFDPAHATFYAALIAVTGAILAAILTFIGNAGTRQHAIREAELLLKLKELQLDDEVRLVELMLRLRIRRWSLRSFKVLNVLSLSFSVVMMMGLILILLLSASRLNANTVEQRHVVDVVLIPTAVVTVISIILTLAFRRSATKASTASVPHRRRTG